MTNSSLNLTAIRYFIKVAESGNITQTANELFITQPVLSRYMKKLEQSTGLELFQRSRSGVELTAPGAHFYRYCKELESSIDTFCNNLTALNGSHVYRLRVGYQKSSEQMMIDSNSSYMQKYPLSSIKVVRQEDVNFKEMLRANQLDIVFNAESEYTAADEDISYAYLRSVPQMLMVSRNNPIAQMERVHISQLRNEAWILPTRESLPQKRESILRYCRLFNFEPNVIGSERQYSNFIINVISCNAVAILTYVKEVALSNPQVAFVPLDGFPSEQNIGLMWRKGNTNPAIEQYTAAARTITGQG